MPTSAEGNFGQDVKARNNETTTAPHVQHPSSTPPEGRQRRETEVPRSNDLEGSSPSLITLTFPITKPLFSFFCNSVKLHFSQRDLLGPNSSVVSENKARGKIILLWPSCRENASHFQCAQKFLVTFLPVFSQKKTKRKREEKEKQRRAAVQFVCAQHPS